MPARRTLLALLIACAACGGGGASTSVDPRLQPTMAIATEISSELLAPLEGLGPCDNDPPEAIAHDVEGLILPEGARVTAVGPEGPVQQIEGWIGMTPVQVRASFVTRDDITVISVEDEVWESESLLSTGTHRTFMKAQAICRTQSVFVAVVSAETPLDDPT